MTAPARSDLSSATRRKRPAGHAVAVVLVTLIVAAFLDADSLVGAIDQQPFGVSRTVGLALARPVRTVSHWTGLNRPHNWLESLIQGTPHHRITVPAAPAPTARTGKRAAPTGQPARTTTTIPTAALRVPTPQQPLKVWMAGDSLMGAIAESFSEGTQHDARVTVTNNVKIGTGLARPDIYNWASAVSQELATVNPDVVVFMFGANDDQDMEAGGHRVPLASPEWRTEYARRVSQLISLTVSTTRQVIWLGIPAVRRPRLNQTKDTINQIVMTAAAQNRGAVFIDTGAIVDAPGGGYTTYLTNAAGQPVKIRESDGIHLTLAGANRLLPGILAAVNQLWGPVAPP
jgi:hypothetical protein